MRLLVERVPQLQRLGVFEAVARLGSFTSAAQELGISQPAVSRHVATLERQLGVALFVRAPNRIELSGEGATLYRAVANGFQLVERALQTLEDASGRLVIAAQPSVTQSWLAPNLEELRSRLHPCAMSLLVFDRESELEGLEYDVAIRAGSGGWPGLRSQKLLAEEVVPVAAPEYAARFGLDENTPAEALLDLNLLDVNRHGRPWMSWQQWFAFEGQSYQPPRESFVYDSYATLIQEAISGNGITLTWRHLRGDLVERGLLVEVGPLVYNPRAGHFLVWAPALDRDQRVRILRDCLNEVIAAGAP